MMLDRLAARWGYRVIGCGGETVFMAGVAEMVFP